MAKAKILLGVLLFATLPLLGAELKSLHKLSSEARAARFSSDAKATKIYRTGLSNVIAFVELQTEIFPVAKPKESRLLRREEKEVVWQTWQRFMEYTMALDSIERYHGDWWRLKGDAKEDAFLISYAAMLANYRASLEFIRAAELNPELEKVLNDAVPELGLPAGTYAKLKFSNLSIRIATEFTASEVTLKTFSGGRQATLREAIKTDAEYIWKAGRGKAELLTAKNALNVLKRGANSAWLPIQTGVSEWMGDTKVYRVGKSLISPAQIESLKTNLLPGDVMLERRDWYLSNVGLPGYWPHGALYIGAEAERSAFFAEADVETWVRKQGEASGDFNALLKSRYAAAWEISNKPQEHEHIPRVIEAISEGVSFTTLEHSADCDALAALRPKLSKVEKAQAILRAFHYAGRPYDFNFDFGTDAELVCTELIYKAYEPANGFIGLTLPTVEMLGRKVAPANEFVKQFDAQSVAGKQQFDLVKFFDGSERSKSARESTMEDFRASWKRPKWHVLTRE